MKKEILKTFEKLGFELEELDDLGYRFMYEGLAYLLMKSDSDEDFLSIAVNAIDDDELEESQCFVLMNKINSTLKYVKANMFAERLWLFYERELIDDSNLEETITRMILHLESGVYFAAKTIMAMKEDDSDGDDNVDIDIDDDIDDDIDLEDIEDIDFEPEE